MGVDVAALSLRIASVLGAGDEIDSIAAVLRQTTFGPASKLDLRVHARESGALCAWQVRDQCLV